MSEFLELIQTLDVTNTRNLIPAYQTDELKVQHVLQ